MGLPAPPEAAALVTGASSGLGVDLARVLAARGHDVVLVARRADRLAALAAELASDHGVRAEAVACDLGDPEARERLPGDVEALGLHVGILVNNAGLAASGPFQESGRATQRLLTRVNVETVVDLCGAFVPAMVDRGCGGVLNVASTTAFQPMPGNATYAASKAFVLSFTEALHQDLSGTGVHATVLCPGPVKTELWDTAGANDTAGRLPGFMWTDSPWVCEEGVKGLEANKRVVVPGVVNRVGALSGQHAPRSVLLRLGALLAPSGDHGSTS